ncbi:MAG TPA: XrtA/PEP-CTERM system histidine kinase PrsK [Sphingomonas sp.]|jgi:putative PEP-CTERM system histidine kinase|nr:XrtA/PEP-CTERM system histidine kinase PrsK [Sphingomonas sp.]
MLILWGNALAALIFGILTLRQASVKGRRVLAAALAASGLWALAAAGNGPGDAGTALAEAVRDIAWLCAMLLFVRASGVAGVAVGAVYAAVATIALLSASLAIASVLPIAQGAGFLAVRALLRMLAAAGALLLVHNALAAARVSGADRAHLVGVALAVMWGVDLAAFGAIYAGAIGPAGLVALRCIGSLASAGIVVLASQRRDARRVVLSRTIAVRSLSAAALGGYTALLALLTSMAGAFGGAHARPAQTAIVIGGTVALLTIVSSKWLRAWTKVKLAKHLFSHRYDYRIEWRRFTDTLGHPAPDAAPLATRVVKAIADLTDSPAGLLLIAQGQRLDAGPAWQWESATDEGDDNGFGAYLAQSGRIVELDAVRRSADPPPVPRWLIERADAWAVVPLAQGDRFAGAVVLARPPVDRALDWEDLDLLRLAATQAAGYLAEDRAHAALAEAQRFDEFSRRFAFLMHDIKNLASQLALTARNAERHAANPDFRADMVATLKESSDRMATLLARLAPQDSARPELLGPVDAAALLRRIAQGRRAQHPVVADATAGLLAVAHAGRLQQVLGHLVQNAIDASAPDAPVHLSALADGAQVAITVADAGAGMSAGFVRDQLFRPFVSTKAGGFGIGAFEARQLVTTMGGTLSVTSREGEGSCFRILLPAAAMMEAAA